MFVLSSWTFWCWLYLITPTETSLPESAASLELQFSLNWWEFLQVGVLRTPLRNPLAVSWPIYTTIVWFCILFFFEIVAILTKSSILEFWFWSLKVFNSAFIVETWSFTTIFSTWNRLSNTRIHKSNKMMNPTLFVNKDKKIQNKINMCMYDSFVFNFKLRRWRATFPFLFIFFLQIKKMKKMMSISFFVPFCFQFQIKKMTSLEKIRKK